MLRANHLSPDLLAQSLSITDANRVGYADICCQRTVYEGWHLEEDIVKSDNSQIDQGVGTCVVPSDKTALAYVGSLCIDSIDRSAKAVRMIGAAGGETSVRVPIPAYDRPVHTAIDSIASLDSAVKVALLNKVETLTKVADPCIVQMVAGSTCEYNMVYVTRLDGKHAANIRPMVRMNVTVIARQGECREQGSAGDDGRYDLAYLDENLVHRFVDSAVKQALASPESRSTPAGEMIVVLDNDRPGVLLHEAVEHGLEDDFNRKETSVFSDRVGKRVAVKGVIAVDQGDIADRRGSLNTDDEGNEACRMVLIEDGILVGYMQDETNARLMGTQSTGNGRHESYASVLMPRITNTFMGNGGYDPEEAIVSIDKGIYMVSLGGRQVDITSGKFVFSVPEARWIEGGKLQYPAKGATIIGNGPRVLKHIPMIGNSSVLDNGIGVYGKEGQSVPVGVGQPTLRADVGLTVGGSGI